MQPMQSSGALFSKDASWQASWTKESLSGAESSLGFLRFTELLDETSDPFRPKGLDRMLDAS